MFTGVGTTPVNIMQATDAEVFANSLALIFSLHCFPLEDILQARRWETVMAETKFDTNVLTEDVVSTASPEVQTEVLGVLLNDDAPLARRIEPSDEHGAAVEAIMDHLHFQGFLVSKDGKWDSTAAAHAGRVAAWRLRKPKLVGSNDGAAADEDDDANDGAVNRLVQTAQADVPIKDLTRYQLMVKLQQQEWTCVPALKRKHVKDIATPYIAAADRPNPKRWFVIQKSSVEETTLFQPYLAALASEHIHQQPVPHFARAQDYMALLDPEYAPPTRKRRVVQVEPGNDDEWADPDPVAPIPKRRPRAKRASKPQMERQSNPWEDKDDGSARSSEHGGGQSGWNGSS